MKIFYGAKHRAFKKNTHPDIKLISKYYYQKTKKQLKLKKLS